MNTVNLRYNFDGNVEDEHGGSFVVESDGQAVAGPFASAPYAITVTERMDNEFPDAQVEYYPEGYE